MSEELQNNFRNLSLSCPATIQFIFSKLNSGDPQSVLDGLVMTCTATDGEHAQVDGLLAYKLHRKIMEFWGDRGCWYIIARTLSNMCAASTQGCYDVIEAGGLGALYDCLTTSDSGLVNQGLQGLANIAANDKRCAKLVASHNNVRLLFSVSEASVSLIFENYIWLFSIIAEFVREDSERSWSIVVFACQRALTRESTPSNTAEQAVSLMGTLVQRPEVDSEPLNACSEIWLQQLSNPSEQCQYLAICALGELINGLEIEIAKTLLQSGMMVKLCEFIGGTNPRIRNVAVWCISNIVDYVSEYTKEVINSGALAIISELLRTSNDTECCKACAQVFLNLLVVDDFEILARLLNEGLASKIVEAHAILPAETEWIVQDAHWLLKGTPLYAQLTEALQQANYNCRIEPAPSGCSIMEQMMQEMDQLDEFLISDCEDE